MISPETTELATNSLLALLPEHGFAVHYVTLCDGSNILLRLIFPVAFSLSTVEHAMSTHTPSKVSTNSAKLHGFCGKETRIR
jgi:hypothetical protein